MRFVAVMVIATALPSAAAWAQEQGKKASPDPFSAILLPPVEVTSPTRPMRRAKQPPPDEAVGSGPLTRDDIARDKVPANVATLGPADIDPVRFSSIADGIVRRMPGVAFADQTGNPFAPDINYRGFVASPVI